MDDALEIHDYLPLAYSSGDEGEYIRFIWEAFESNYPSEKYQFAILALHMAKKIMVSQSTSGEAPESGLDVFNQGGDSVEA